MSKRGQRGKSRNQRQLGNIFHHVSDDKFIGGGCLSPEDINFLNGKTEDAYKVQFQTTDLSKVLEGV